MPKLISLVLPIFNEKECIPLLIDRLLKLCENDRYLWEIIFVNDGSSDGSDVTLKGYCQKDSRLKYLSLSRNFGHQIAITAGMAFAKGEAVIVMDADLQDPPEIVEAMLEKWAEGFQIVYAKRTRREGETLFKLLTASFFYRILEKVCEIKIPRDVGDFRLVDRVALNSFLEMKEQSRFVRGLFSWIGFNQTFVEFERAARVAGETKYPFKKMLRLAVDAILGFSTWPLRFVMNFGFFVSGIAFLYGITAIVLKLTGAYTASGWTSIIVVLSFLGGIQLVALGILGEYIGRIHNETKGRPLYIVKESMGFEAYSQS